MANFFKSADLELDKDLWLRVFTNNPTFGDWHRHESARNPVQRFFWDLEPQIIHSQPISR
ncbi:hypothetical protein C8J56DRAFT_1042975 [Mycena floridula]|nr:hypothetical protein C8J56DRAFT_1042975 [Mycena floridula]